ncbi:TerB family tellurite resistance protein [Flavobacterium sp.]|uniref:TerB family tellurite resistance protein n=1 Tax=Flavobacterium sp. TaxID=239 RepID=UPI0037C0B452
MNNTKAQKISLLSDMIAFAVVDGKLHKNEFQFLSLIAEDLEINPTEFQQLFHTENQTEVIKDDFERIQQFYRLALLMHSDGILHEREEIRIHEIGIGMGLDPFAMKRVLKAMSKSQTRMLSPDYLLEVFKEQNN